MKGCLLLTRPTNVLLVVASVALGSYLCGGLGSLKVLLACVSAGLILAGGNAINDLFDVEIDTVNNPRRPIPSGAVTRREASLLAVALFAVGIAMSVFVGFAGFCMAAVSTLLLVFYGFWFKRTVLMGNAVVALLGALAFVYGGVSAGEPRNAFFPALFAFLFHLGREIVKDVEDVAGDRKGGAKTIPIVLGERGGVTAASVVFGMFFFATLLPFASGDYGFLYLVLVLLGVDSLVLVVALSLLMRKKWMNVHQASNLLKVGMVFGLAALAVSPL